MIYTWDNKHRNDTFRTCLSILDRTKGYDAEFDFIEADTQKLTLWIDIHDQALEETEYAIYFWWEYLARAIGKLGQDIDFEKLTEKQYLKLCEYIISEVWRVVKMVYKKD